MSHGNQQYPAHWTPVDVAAYRLVHTYDHDGKRGAEAMGPRIGKSPRLLSNEVNPDYEGAKLGLITAVNIERESGQADILQAHAQMLHHICFALPNPETFTGDVELLTLFAEWQAALGRTCEEIRSALDDGRVTTDEVNAIIRRGYRHMTAFMELLERFKELAE